MNRLNILSLGLLVIILSGCVTEYKESKYQLYLNEYSRQVSKRSRNAKLYLKLETVMIVDAVLIDDGLIKAWVDEQGRARRLSEEEKKALLQNEKNEKYSKFVLAVYTSESAWNDLAERDSRWTILLNSGGGDSLHPVKIEKAKLENLSLRDHVPFDTRFRAFYVVSFPKDKTGGLPYHLLLSSPLGEVKLAWTRL